MPDELNSDIDVIRTADRFLAGPDAPAEPAAEPAAEAIGPATLHAAIAKWVVEKIHNSPLSRDTDALNHFRGKLSELTRALEAHEVATWPAHVEAWLIDLVTSGPPRSHESIDHARQAVDDLKRRLSQE